MMKSCNFSCMWLSLVFLWNSKILQWLKVLNKQKGKSRKEYTGKVLWAVSGNVTHSLCLHSIRTELHGCTCFLGSGKCGLAGSSEKGSREGLTSCPCPLPSSRESSLLKCLQTRHKMTEKILKKQEVFN